MVYQISEGLYIGKKQFSFKTFFSPKNSIRAHVRHISFATLQIELYRVVDYDNKWSTKSHKDCMLEKSLLRRILIFLNCLK